MALSKLSGQTIEARVAARGDATGFDYMRMFLASSVLLMHSIVTAEGTASIYQLWTSPSQAFWRAILPMFFALSGFLVAGSLERTTLIGSR